MGFSIPVLVCSKIIVSYLVAGVTLSCIKNMFALIFVALISFVLATARDLRKREVDGGDKAFPAIASVWSLPWKENNVYNDESLAVKSKLFANG